MRPLQQQTASIQRAMSALRKRLKTPEPYLILLALAALLGLADAWRAPEKQLTGAVYVGAIRNVYQPLMRPVLRRRVVCRHTPSCSDYSMQVVAAHGIGRGLLLTIRRVRACDASVPMGTSDPAPTAHGQRKLCDDRLAIKTEN